MRSRYVAFACALILAISCGSCAQDKGQQSANIEKPVWRVGDSWQVKCPVMRGSPRGPKDVWQKVGEYTVTVQVTGSTELRGGNCLVLKMKPCEDLPEIWKNTSPLIVAERAYYRVEDLMLVRLEGIGKNGNSEYVRTSLNWTPENNSPADAEARGWGIPLQLPLFPVASGSSAERFQRDSTKLKSTREAVDKGENVVTSRKWVMTSEAVTPVQEPSIKASGVKVSFTERRTYSKSGDYDELVLEEIWVPGKPWWSVARVYTPSRSPRVMEYVLIDQPVAGK